MFFKFEKENTKRIEFYYFDFKYLFLLKRSGGISQNNVVLMHHFIQSTATPYNKVVQEPQVSPEHTSKYVDTVTVSAKT